MYVALPSVNYISHEVNTCIRTIFQSYPITRHKIVLASSAMFDVIKNVMSSTVLEERKKKKDAKAEQSTHRQGQCDLPWTAEHPGSGPPPIQSQLGFICLLVVAPHQRKVGWAGRKYSWIQDFVKAVHLQPHASSPSDYQNAFESWRKYWNSVCEVEESSLKGCECCR